MTSPGVATTSPNVAAYPLLPALIGTPVNETVGLMTPPAFIGGTFEPVMMGSAIPGTPSVFAALMFWSSPFSLTPIIEIVPHPPSADPSTPFTYTLPIPANPALLGLTMSMVWWSWH